MFAAATTVQPFAFSWVEFIIFSVMMTGFFYAAASLAVAAWTGLRSVQWLRAAGALIALSWGLWYLTLVLLALGVLPLRAPTYFPPFEMMMAWSRFSNAMVLGMLLIWTLNRPDRQGRIL